MAAELREFRAAARDACVGDLVQYLHHGWVEVVERSYGPDPAVVRTDDGRLIAIPPGEWVEIRHLADEAEIAVEESVEAQVESTDLAGAETQHPPVTRSGTEPDSAPAGTPDPVMATVWAMQLRNQQIGDPAEILAVGPAALDPPRGALDDYVALERDIDRALAYLTAVKTRLQAMRGDL